MADKALAMTACEAAATKSDWMPRPARHDGILQTHGPAKLAKILCLIVIGFRPNSM
jgi:hypothetical protein